MLPPGSPAPTRGGGGPFGPSPGGGPAPAAGPAPGTWASAVPEYLVPTAVTVSAPARIAAASSFVLLITPPVAPRASSITVVDTPDPGPTADRTTAVPRATSPADSGPASIPTPATPASAAAPVSPRRVIASASACLALHTRPDTVPTFHPSRRAASACRTPCRTHRTNGTRKASGSRSISAYTASCHRSHAASDTGRSVSVIA